MLRKNEPQESFYQYLMSRRNLKKVDDPIANFANNAFYDESFPKQSKNYNKISNYLEEYGSYLPNMTIFDKVWQQYQDNIH
ncbi:YozE family protein [Acetilactobacillus jinshanensis]|uniref:UPF0346 protein ELX58_02380 n=1 Tax=Acetilactobacillus jinshanensis TaxID=1720083 RepID=A0A4P6ZJZ2_9LACO|nr:YozE family protein [Acetilactobacillus jinshanensis]QBP18016.1 YozE family protein [Acetilactobacillus jinshanensis]URL60879.1 YozE family protein [uncultured bacterium]